MKDSKKRREYAKQDKVYQQAEEQYNACDDKTGAAARRHWATTQVAKQKMDKFK